MDKPSADLALKRARKAAKDGSKIVWGLRVEDRLPSLGSARYKTHHKLRYPDPSILQASVDDFMTAFAATEAARTRHLTHQRSVPDADGFITVTRGGRSGPAREEAVRAQEEELKKRDKSRVKADFYRWQVKEQRKEAQVDLVKQMRDDERRLVEMRKAKEEKLKTKKFKHA